MGCASGWVCQMTRHGPINLQTHILFQAARVPWLSASHLGWRANVLPEVVQTMCQSLVEAGLLQTVISRHPSYSALRYAPTPQGLTQLASELSLSDVTLARRLKWLQERFWALRTSLPTGQELAALRCASMWSLMDHTNHSSRPQFEGCDWDIFIQRQHKTEALFLHGQIQFYTADRAFPFFLLLDRGESSVWQWQRHLHYLNVWAKRTSSPKHFPPLLIITTRQFRAMAMLALAHMAGHAVSVAVTSDRPAVLGHAVLPTQNTAMNGSGVPRRPVRWQALNADEIVVEVNPFAGAGVDRGVDRNVLQNTMVAPSSVARSSLERQRRHESIAVVTGTASPFNLTPTPEGLADLEGLEGVAYKLLVCLSRNPVMPLSSSPF